VTLLNILEGGVPAIAFLLMVAVGLDVTREDLREIAKSRALLAAATVAPVLLLPAAALIVARLLTADSRIIDYLLLTAACPGGGMSNVYVYLARANTALSVTLTALSSLLAVLTMPPIIAAYQVVLGRTVGFALPVRTLLAQLLVMAVIPIVIGAVVRDRRPELERQYGGRFRAISAAGVVGIVAVGMVQSAGSLQEVLVTGAPAAAALVAAGMAAGWMMGAVFGSPHADRFTLLVEFGVRSLAIAMVIQVTLLHDPEFVPFGAVALFAQALLLMIAVRVYRSGAGGA
jgi:BASS family bile acid:Na+ symporter